jgi:predicted enzyme related to lactoylglutathione lyase
MTTPTTGRFAWHELHTTDKATALTFYAKLVGWETKEVPMGPGETYGLCRLGGKDVAGITTSKAGPGVPPHWLPYIAVEDVDASASRAKELGGGVLSEPMDIPNVGRFAVLTDPQGAVFALFRQLTPYDAEPAIPPPGAFCWEELVTSDPEAAAKFYAALFGYTIDGPMETGAGPYRIFKRGEQRTGGIMKLPPGVQQSNWLAYVAVHDVDAATHLAKELGGQVYMPPTDIPDVGGM